MRRWGGRGPGLRGLPPPAWQESADRPERRASCCSVLMRYICLERIYKMRSIRSKGPSWMTSMRPDADFRYDSGPIPA